MNRWYEGLLHAPNPLLNLILLSLLLSLTKFSKGHGLINTAWFWIKLDIRKNWNLIIMLYIYLVLTKRSSWRGRALILGALLFPVFYLWPPPAKWVWFCFHKVFCGCGEQDREHFLHSLDNDHQGLDVITQETHSMSLLCSKEPGIFYFLFFQVNKLKHREIKSLA